MTAPRTFQIREMQSTWGIYLRITARRLHRPDEPSGPLRVGGQVWLDTSRVRLAKEDMVHLVEGLSRVAPAIERLHPSDHVVIEILDADLDLTDYQPEAMAAAIVGWSAEEFGLDVEMPVINFDKAARRYTFEWSDHSNEPPSTAGP